MKQKYSLILVSFALGIVFLGMILFLFKRAKPLILKIGNQLEERRLNNLPKSKEALVLCDFEDSSDLKKWKLDNSKIELNSEHATSGKQSVKIYLQSSGGASGLKIEDFFEKNKTMTNWAGYEVLSFDIFNPNNNPERIILQFKDKKNKRMKLNMRLNPNTNNHIEINISELQGKLNPAEIIQFNLFLWENKQTKVFYLDNIRLLPASAFEKEKKDILDADFLPRRDEKIYATGDYFAFDNSNWLKEDKTNNISFVEIPLGIRNPLSIDCKDLPFSGGIPFPRGQLKSLEQLELVDNQGSNIPFQSKILSLWPDKSIKWTSVTLQSGLTPNREGRLFLRYKNNFQKQSFQSSLFIEESPDSVIVNTGVLKLSIGKKGFYLFDNLWLDKNKDGKFDDDEILSAKADLVLVHNGTEYYSHLDKDYAFVLEEKGPIRACIKAKGWFVSEKGDKFCQFIVRIYAFSGSSSLKVQHTFIFTGYPENSFHYLYKEKRMPKNETIDAIYLTIPLTLVESSKFTFAADTKVIQGDFAETVEFLQQDSNAYEVVKNNRVLNSGNKLRGWLDLSNNDDGLSLGLENFWEQFPKGFLLDKSNNRIVLYLWPKQSQALDFKTTQEAYGPGEYARGSAFGVAKTHDIFLYFHKANYETSAAKNTIEGLISDSLISVDPKWVSYTRILGKVWPYDNSLAREEDFLSRLFDWGNRQIADFAWYGMVNFGDTLSWYRKEAYDKSYDEWGWHPEGRWGWFNCEGVGTHTGALIQFLRTNNYKYLIFGRNLARHIMDIDTCHYNTIANDPRLKNIVPDDYSQVGSMHRHNANHWGGRNDESSHTNVYGLILYYYITGDERARDVIDEIGNYFLSERVTYFNHPDIAPQRTLANVLWGDVLMFELTQEERYKKAADKWADIFYQGQKHDGSWSENYNPVAKRWEGKAHMIYIRNYTLPALIAYHQLSANKAIADSIVKATDFVIKNEQYLPYFDASSYSYWLTGDKKYADNIKARMEYTVKRQRKNNDPLRDGMVLEKPYYLRVMDFLYTLSYALEVIANTN